MQEQKQEKKDFGKIHERSSEFFASKKFKDFRDELASLQIPIKDLSFTELSYKCCGYGYFPQYKEKILHNFISYLTDSVELCKNLATLKIVFNGFDVDDNSLRKICQAIYTSVERKTLRTVWFHTTNLRKCRLEDLVEMFTIYDKCGLQITCEEISIQMADWEFTQGYPTYFQLAKVFNDFYENIVDGLKFRKFRLEISSWYMKEKEAYNFLKETLEPETIVSKFKTPRNDGATGNNAVSRLNQDEANQALQYFIKNMDIKYNNPKYKYKKGDQNYSPQEKLDHEQMINKMNQYQELIGKKLIKYPNEYIMQLRVEEFHSKMMVFLGGLLYKLPNIQQYHIDLRNWSNMFGMPALKKSLDTKVNSKQEFSLIRRSLGLGSKIGKGPAPGESQDVGLKTIYTM